MFIKATTITVNSDFSYNIPVSISNNNIKMIFNKTDNNLELESEFLKAGILGSRIPDIILEESGHLRTNSFFSDYFQEKTNCWTNNLYKKHVIRSKRRLNA